MVELISLFEQFFALVEAPFAFLQVQSDELAFQGCVRLWGAHRSDRRANPESKIEADPRTASSNSDVGTKTQSPAR